jgi:ketosteroid isomerase-like protein
MPTIDGKDAIRTMYETTFPIYSIKQDLTIEECEAGADLAFVRGKEDFRVVPKQPDHPPHSWPSIRTLTVLRRVEGEWKIARVMNNQADPATPPEGDPSS